MSYRLSLIATATLYAGVFLTPSVALAVPSGSYLQSCSNVRQSGNTVSAVCADRNGVRIRTTINMNICSTDRLSNLNGSLRCEGGLPQGSYRQTCQDTVVENNVLRARCRNRGGALRNTNLGLPCRGSISNNDGQLLCIR
jgi:hypothetical protein